MKFQSANMLLFTTSPFENKRQVLIKKVRMMANFPAGFSHGEGFPVTEASILVAEQLIQLASDLELDADVFPNLDGGCAVAFYRDLGRVEASIGPEGDTVDLRIEHGIGFQFEEVISPKEDVGFGEIMERAIELRGLNNHIWKLFASSTSGNSTGSVDDFGMCFTGIPQSPVNPLPTVKGGSQSLRWLVPARQVG